MEQLGYFDDLVDCFGMFDGQWMCVVRVVFDIGVYFGKLCLDGIGVWDVEYVFDFMCCNVNMLDQFVQFEVNCYFGWFGQVLLYKVGQCIWEQVCDEVCMVEGEVFFFKDFYKCVFDMGGVGLDILWMVLLLC